MIRLFTKLILVIACLAPSLELQAQCNQTTCTQLPPPGLCAEDACIMCDPCFLNSFQGTTIPGSNQCDWPAGFCGTIENNQWYAFMAPPSGQVTFNFNVFNCTQGQGIQAVVYSTDDCNNFVQVSNCWSPGVQTPGTVTATNLQPYCTYYLMVDGFAGDFCEFTISTSDCMVPPAPTPIVITGPNPVCPGAIVQYTMQPPPSAACGNNSNEIVWSGIQPYGTIIGPSNGPTITVQWNSVGVAVLTVSVNNVCFGPKVSAPFPVTIQPIPPTVVEKLVCLGECTTCAGLTICEPGLTPVTLTSWLGCDSVVNCIINPIPPKFTDLGAVTLCAPATFNMCGQTFNTCGVHSATCDSWQGCDSTTIVDLAILDPKAIIAPPPMLGCAPGSSVTIDGSASTVGSSCLPNVVTSYSWTGPPGGISGPATGNTVTATKAGQYCLTVTHSRGGVSCSNTKCVTVVKDNAVPQTPQISGQANAICPGDTITYTATPVGSPAPTGYTWSTTGGGIIIGSGSSVQVVWPTSGTHQVCVTADNECGASNPACLNVTVNPAPTAVISGADTVCMGSSDPVDLTITLTGGSPWTVGYTIDGVPQPPLTIPASPYTFTVTQPGTYELTSVSGNAGCPGTVSGAGVVSEYPVPTAVISGNGIICAGSSQTVDLQIDFTGTSPWTVVYAVNGTPQAPVNFSTNPGTLTLGQAQAGSITLVSVTDGNGCPGTVSGTSQITILNAPTVSNINASCDPTNTTYTVSFNINGGDPATYSVTPPNGTLTGNTFTSNPIPSGTPYSFTVSDANDCAPVTISNTVLCDCTTKVGDMEDGPLAVCGDGPVTVNYDGNHVFDADDTLVFILHSGNGINIVPPIIGTYGTPEVGFDPATMSYGTTYYLSAVVGNNDGNGGVDLNDPCLAVAQGTPIVFNQIPTAHLEGDPVICLGEQAVFEVTFTGPGPWSVTYDAGAGPQVVNGINANPYDLTLSPQNSTTVCLTSMANTACTGTVSGCGDVTVHTAVLVSAPVIECNAQGTAYTVTFSITGGDPTSYTVTPPDGTLAGNVFKSNPIPDTLGFSFVVNDANDCGPKTVAQNEVDCSCTTMVGVMTSPLQEICGNGPATAVYDDSNEVLDPDDVRMFILHTNSGTSVGTILDSGNQPSFSFDPTTMSYGTVYYISAVVGNNDGAGGVSLSDPCLQVAAGSPVIFHEIPTAVLIGGEDVCEGDSSELEIQFTGVPPFDVTLNGQLLSGINTLQTTLQVAPANTTTYTLSNLSDAYCDGTVSGSATITTHDAPMVTNIQTSCIPDTNLYQVSFEITGGDPSSYQVTPMNGTLNGNVFTSTPQPSLQPAQFVVRDQWLCGFDTAAAVLDCNCYSDAGTMSSTLYDACINEGIAVPPSTGVFLDSNDVLLYFLHTGSGEVLDTVIATNTLPGFTFDPNTMQPGKTYYISAVVGNDDGNGGIDFDDHCLDIAAGTPVLWHALPSAFIAASEGVCEGQPAIVNLTMTGTGPFNVSFSINGNPQSLSNITSPHSFQITPTGTTTLELIAVTDVGTGCSSPASGSATILIHQRPEAGTPGNPAEFCDSDVATVNLFDLLTGEDPGGTWTDAAGNVVPNGLVDVQPLSPGVHAYRYTLPPAPPCPGDDAEVEIVIYANPVADAGNDRELDCETLEVTIGGPKTTTGASYQWSGPVLQPNLPVTTTSTPGTYVLTVTNQFGCTATDAVVVTKTVTLPEPHVSVSDISCFGRKDGFIRVDSVTNGAPPYLFSFNGGPFEENDWWYGLSAGTYTVVVMDAKGCERSLEFKITEPEQVTVDIILDIEGPQNNTIELGDSVFMTVQVTPAWDSLDKIIWSPQGIIPCDTCQSQWLQPTEEMTFSITVEKNGCKAKDTETIYVSRDYSLYVPNAFSPNNDGTNDLFMIFGGPNVKNIRSFLVFNRWGETVWEYHNFQPNDPVAGWDGRHRGQLLNPAVFTWFAEVEFIDGKVVLFEGDVTLMR